MAAHSTREEETTTDDQVVSRYLRLMDRCRKSISILEGLPLHVSSCSSVDPFVAKAFESLNELWRLQMSARPILERTYKLKRWEIGEIASRLGQLHYYAFTRRGDPESLRLAFNFYNVIQQRQYMDLPKDLQQRHTPFVIKKMRVLARFAVVCVHLDKLDELEEVLRTLKALSESLSGLAHSNEAVSFAKLVEEGEAMLEVLRRDATLGSRGVSANAVSPTHAAGEGLVVSNAVLAFNQEGELKLSELPFCLLRFSQSLEWDRTPKATPVVQKSMLYRPTVLELITQTSSVLANLNITPTPGSPKGALFLYINANAGDKGIDLGEAEGLQPTDLSFALRRPVFLVLEGKGVREWFEKGSAALKGVLDVPFVVMLSEDDRVSSYLTNPVSAILGEREASPDAGQVLEKCTDDTIASMRRHPNLNPSLAAFLTSPFTARYLARFALCYTAARVMQPLLYPQLPADILSDQALSSCIEQIQSGE